MKELIRGILRPRNTPTTPEGLRKFDGLPPAIAVSRAWSDPGVKLEHHRKMQERVRLEMPVLARALDRIVEVEP